MITGPKITDPGPEITHTGPASRIFVREGCQKCYGHAPKARNHTARRVISGLGCVTNAFSTTLSNKSYVISGPGLRDFGPRAHDFGPWARDFGHRCVILDPVIMLSDIWRVNQTREGPLRAKTPGAPPTLSIHFWARAKGTNEIEFCETFRACFKKRRRVFGASLFCHSLWPRDPPLCKNG